MKKKIITILFLIVLQGSIYTQDNIRFSENGFINFQNQDFYFFISLVDDLGQALDIWSVPDEIPRIPQIASIKINEPISLFIVYAADKDKINLTYNLRIIKPDESISETEIIGAKISNILINRRLMYAADQLPTLIFDSNDDIGVYHFIVEIYDFDELIVILILQFSVIG